VAERCQQVSQAVSLIEVGYILVIVFSVAAILCVFFGVVYVLKDERMAELY
jgi:hypothetical protein